MATEVKISMSFIDNQKIVGWAFFIVGILLLVMAVVSLYSCIGEDNAAGKIIVCIGVLVAAILYTLFGNKVRTGSISGKVDVLGNYVNIVGATVIVEAIFAVIGGIIIGEDTMSMIGGGIILVIVGLIVMWAGRSVMDGKKTFGDKILWAILLIAFVVMFVLEFLEMDLGSAVSIISGVLHLLIYLFMIGYLLDGEVRDAMGV